MSEIILNFSLEDDVLLDFIAENRPKYSATEIFQKAIEQESVLFGKSDLALYLRYHGYLVPTLKRASSGESVVEESQSMELIEEDIALLNFVMDNVEKYRKYELYEMAKEIEILSGKSVLDLYLRYHRYLYPLMTGKVSNENVPLNPEIQKLFKTSASQSTVTRPISAPVSAKDSTSSDDSSESGSSLEAPCTVYLQNTQNARVEHSESKKQKLSCR